MSDENGQESPSNTQSMLMTPEMELKMLKERANVMGITYSNNIGIDTLRAKIAAKMEGKDLAESEDDNSEPEQENPMLVNSRHEKQHEEEDEQEIVHQPNALDITAAFAAAKDSITEEQLSKIIAILNNNGVDKDEPVISPVTEQPKRKLSLREYLVQEEMKLIRVRITNLDPKKKDLKGEIFTVANEYLGTVRKYIPYGEYTDGGYHIPNIIFKELNDRKFLNIRTSTDKSTGQIKVEDNWAKEFALEVLPPLTAQELKDLANQQAASGSTGY